MMVTQLENQDPLNPTDSQTLLAQESSIGQLEAATDTQTTMQSLTLQTQIGSASNLIGKGVTGIDANNNSVSGTVSSVQVSSGSVNLQLDNGSSLSLSNVASIDGDDDSSSTTSSN
jgi:flagellar basal-body rod modification protein FlgD